MKVKARKGLFATSAIVILLGTPLSVIALGKNEKGCLAGGAIGGLGGHFIGSGSTTNTVLGAAAGCAVGTVVAKNKSEKQHASDQRKRERTRTARYSASDERRTSR